MADLSELDRAGAVKIAGGNPSTGLEDNFLEVDTNGWIGVRLYDASGSAVDTNYGTVGAHTLRTASQIGNATGGADFNYGTAGAQTLRTASQIGNATGGALFGAGTTTAQVLRVVLPTDQTAIPVTQSGTWTVQPGNTANTTPWLTTDSADGPVTPGAVAGKSQLMGGQFNTALPTLTNTQQSAIQLDSSGRLIIAPPTVTAAEDKNYGTVGANTLRTASQIGNATGSADFNYGTAGAQTLRTASQIGNATGAALFGAGTTTAQVLRVVLPTDQTAIPATQSGTWTVQPGNTANTTPWLVTDSSDGPVTPGAVAGKSSLAGGQFNTALPTLTNTQQSSIQLDSSGRLIIAPLTSTSVTTAAEDHNFGAVGANTLRAAAQIGNATGSADFNYGTAGAQTLRTASQIGNATGAALFGAGTTTAQVLRVVLPTDQTAIPATQSGTWTVQPGNTQNTTAWLTQDAADGPVTPGAVASKSILIGGQFNTALPSLTNTQQSAIQLDSSGRLLVSGITSDSAPATVNITARDIASTVTAGANNQSIITGAATANSTASFAFVSEDSISLQITGVWTGTMQAEVSLDGGTTWYIRPIVQAGTVIVSGTFTGNFTGICNVSGYTNFRIRSTAVMTGTATVKIIESINPSTIYIANPLGISDSGGDQIAITPNNDLQVADLINVSGQNRAQSVTTSAAEALGAASILTNRKMLSITPTNGTVYWGFSNAVTTSSGTPIFKNQTMVFAVGSNVHIYLIAGSTVDCRISEGS